MAPKKLKSRGTKHAQNISSLTSTYDQVSQILSSSGDDDLKLGDAIDAFSRSFEKGYELFAVYFNTVYYFDVSTRDLNPEAAQLLLNFFMGHELDISSYSTYKDKIFILLSLSLKLWNFLNVSGQIDFLNSLKYMGVYPSDFLDTFEDIFLKENFSNASKNISNLLNRWFRLDGNPSCLKRPSECNPKNSEVCDSVNTREVLRFILSILNMKTESTQSSLLKVMINYCSENCQDAIVMWSDMWEKTNSMSITNSKTISINLLHYAFKAGSLHMCREMMQDLEDIYHFRNDLNLQHIDLIYHPPMLYLLTISLLDKEPSIRLSALQVLVEEAVSFHRSNREEESHSPTYWRPILIAIGNILSDSIDITAALRTPLSQGNKRNHPGRGGLKKTVGKGIQYSAITTLSSLLDQNIFTREFPVLCTKEESFRLITEEIHILQQSNFKLSSQQPPHGSLITILQQELQFQEDLHEYCIPPLLDILNQSKRTSVAKRTVTAIQSMLCSRSIGVDVSLLIASIDSVDDTITPVLVSILLSRCASKAAVQELCQRAVLGFVHRVESGLTAGKAFYGDSADILQQTQIKQLRQLLSTWSANGNKTVAAGRSGVVEVFLSLLQDLDALSRDQPWSVVSENMSTSPNTETGGGEAVRSWEGDTGLFKTMELSIVATVLSETFPGHFTRHCKVFLHALPLIQARLRITSSLRLSALTSVWLHAVAIQIRHDTTPSQMILGAVSLLYPDVLSNPVLVSSAVTLALCLPSSMHLLFRCIGYLQDMAFPPGKEAKTSLSCITQYINLIEVIIRENRRNIHHSVWDNGEGPMQAVPKDDDEGQRPDKGLNKDFETAIFYDEDKDDDGGLYDQLGDDDDDDENSIVNMDVSRHTSISQNHDYMRRACTEEHRRELERVLLERSVTADDSFLSCFLPMIVQLILSGCRERRSLLDSTTDDPRGSDQLSPEKGLSVPVEVLCCAMRCLGAYTSCSPSILRDYLFLVENPILNYTASVTQLNRNGEDVVDVSSSREELDTDQHTDTQISSNLPDITIMQNMKESLGLCTEALSVWIGCFSADVMSPIVIVKSLYNKVTSLVTAVNHEPIHLQHGKEWFSSYLDITSEYCLCLARCLTHLITEDKVKYSVEIALAVTVPLAFINLNDKYGRHPVVPKGRLSKKTSHVNPSSDCLEGLKNDLETLLLTVISHDYRLASRMLFYVSQQLILPTSDTDSNTGRMGSLPCKPSDNLALDSCMDVASWLTSIMQIPFESEGVSTYSCVFARHREAYLVITSIMKAQEDFPKKIADIEKSLITQMFQSRNELAAVYFDSISPLASSVQMIREEYRVRGSSILSDYIRQVLEKYVDTSESSSRIPSVGSERSKNAVDTLKPPMKPLPYRSSKESADSSSDSDNHVSHLGNRTKKKSKEMSAVAAAAAAAASDLKSKSRPRRLCRSNKQELNISSSESDQDLEF